MGDGRDQEGKRFALIMAGGQGGQLWPLSTSEKLK